MGRVKTDDALDELLRDCGIQRQYLDVNHQPQRAATETLLALLQTLGVAIENPERAADILSARRRLRAQRGVEPVLVAWDGRLEPINVSLPARASGSISYELDAVAQRLSGELRVDELNAVLLHGESSLDFVTRQLTLFERLPSGYHRLTINFRERQFRALVVSAPKLAYSVARLHNGDDSEKTCEDSVVREWAAFLPLYAARRDGDWGAGDFTALKKLASWIGKLGGSAVGTLPLLAASLDEPFEPSPYRPVSRQYWNEFYVDLLAVPELHPSQHSREVVESPQFGRRLAELRRQDTVHYREIMRLKQQVIADMAAYFFAARPQTRYAQFRQFLAENPDAESYARFRAVMQREKKDWLGWPRELQESIGPEDADPKDVQYHLYAQWITAEQLGKVKSVAEANGCGLYLDLPVGVDPGGFDVWRNKDLFVLKATTGAPPDPFFSKGQDWGLPPLHPERLRESGYHLLRQVLSANMKFAKYLRIDHAMGWHRLYWIPQGEAASEGAYVHYPADEFYAIASLESHRHKCTLLAENMGTVPPEVNESLQRHGIGGMWVAPYELEPSRRRALSPPPSLCVASLNTHDMPPAAAWWQGLDVEDRQSLGLLNAGQAEAERVDRRQATSMLEDWLRRVGAYPLLEESEDIPPVAALLRALAMSDAQLVLVNLEDLWHETRSQNVPGTLHERPNWQRKARYSLEEFMHRSDVVDILTEITALRKRNSLQGSPPGG
jgi:4-alpha-glucanotransferase